MGFTFSNFDYPSLIYIAVILLVLTAVWHRYKGLKFFYFLRILVFLSVVFLLFEPQRVVYDSGSEKPVVAVMVDVSKSMQISDPVLRFVKIKEFFRKYRAVLEEKYQISFYPFSGSSSRVDADDFEISKMQGDATDIASVISEVGRELRGRLSAAILITDGGHNTAGDPVNDSKTFGAPIYCVGVGNPDGASDLAIADLKVSDFAFKNTPIEIDCVLKAAGFKDRLVQVILREGKEIAGQKSVRIKSSFEKRKVSFSFVPKKVGSFRYSVYTPVLKGEASDKNNRKYFMLDVVREKLRVLYICGQPSSEYSFLRRVLKSDPSVEMVSFVILRNPDNISFVPDNQLSLIPFPAREIFLEKLFNFDLLIFENFTYRQFGFMPVYLENIKNYVIMKGGSFLMIGGKNAFGSGNYKGTPVEDILPVTIAGVEEEYVDEMFRLKVDQLKHPIMAISDVVGENQRLWDKMPRLDGYNRFMGVKEGAVQLASDKRSGNPIVAVWDKGKGRVMAVAANTTWRWAMGLAREGKTPLYYNRFWRRAVRWLTRADKMKLVHISLDKRSYKLDDKMVIKALVRDRSYQPLDQARVKLQVDLPDKSRVNILTYGSGSGEYAAELDLEIMGNYKFTARAFDPRESETAGFLGEDRRSVEVSVYSKEDESLEMNESLLLEIARSGGGKYSRIDDFKAENLDEFIKRKGKKMVKEKIQFWNSPYIYIILLCLLTAEWFLRRRKGLL